KSVLRVRANSRNAAESRVITRLIIGIRSRENLTIEATYVRCVCPWRNERARLSRSRPFIPPRAPQKGAHAARWRTPAAYQNGLMASPVNPPRGMRDFLPADKQRRERVLSVIRDVYRAHGFDEIETPVMEDSSRLHAG